MKSKSDTQPPVADSTSARHPGKTLATVIELLQPLSDDSRERVLKACAAFYDLEFDEGI